jgi:putative ABC transport system permease protein
MNLFSLVIKQMRQRALGTWLTLLSVMLGVALAISIMILYREAGTLFGQSDYGYDVILGKKGSSTQLVMNSVYMLDRSPGNLPYSLYEDMIRNPQYHSLVRIAVPYVVGDSYQGKYRIVGTTPSLFGFDDDGKPLPPEKVLEYRPDHRYQIAAGHDFGPEKFEAIIGSDLAKISDLRIGKTFRATHGMPLPGETPDNHKSVWTVVGILAPTHTAADRVVFIPYKSLYTIGEHDIGMLIQLMIRNHKPIPSKGMDPDDVKVYDPLPNNGFKLLLPKDAWEVSAILVKARSDFAAQNFMYQINNGDVAQAVNPAQVMRTFFDTFLKGPTLVLLLVACLVTIVAAVGILVSIYNSVSARMREIAIMRALGATRVRVLLLICVEAGLIGLFGGLLGLLGGHLLAGIGSFFFDRYIGESIHWIRTDYQEWLYLGAVVIVAVIAGLVPAYKAYTTPVATNLVAV